MPAADGGVPSLGAEASARSTRLGEAVVASPSWLKNSVLVGYVKFKPTISTNPVVVFQAEGSRSRMKVGAGLGWSEYQAGDFRCLPTPGSHFTIFDVPNIDVLATN